MAKKKKNEVALECVQCKSRNYWTHKKSGPNPEKIELSKHCPRCNKHTAHKETKKSK
ncbi:MAG TPA: 50S ribosomal protein L33 [bacterium]|nr:50S ribosomal protein L33 [bacterium]HPM27963.1 50S ribosomal protein L33 [bacterium]